MTGCKIQSFYLFFLIWRILQLVAIIANLIERFNTNNDVQACCVIHADGNMHASEVFTARTMKTRYGVGK
jgi:hypothetical protein